MRGRARGSSANRRCGDHSWHSTPTTTTGTSSWQQTVRPSWWKGRYLMAVITVPGMFLTGDHASRPAATAVGGGSLYSCSDHSLIYQSDGASWSTWATLGSVGSGLT